MAFDVSRTAQTTARAFAGVFDGAAASDITASGWPDDVYLGRRMDQDDAGAGIEAVDTWCIEAMGGIRGVADRNNMI